MKITAYKSDVSGELIADERELARIRVTFADKRRNARVIDLTAAEVEQLLGTAGRTTGTPGRRPRSNGDAPAA